MKRFDATVAWQRAGQAFTDQRYSRAHAWHVDGGLADLHREAHARCYIANALRAEVVVEGCD